MIEELKQRLAELDAERREIIRQLMKLADRKGVEIINNHIETAARDPKPEKRSR